MSLNELGSNLTPPGRAIEAVSSNVNVSQCRGTHLYQRGTRSLDDVQRGYLSNEGIQLTDVDNVSFAVYHDVSVVPILDLKDVTGNRVGRHGLNKVQPSLLEGNGILSSELTHEEAEEIVDLCAAHLVSRGRVWDDINNTALSNG